MAPSKRALDLAVSILLLALLWPIILLIALALLLREGRPVFYIAERMQTPDRGFGLIKFRTMRPAPEAANRGVTGGDKSARMSRLHRLLRRSRADELPQLWNVIRGDMSLVGPRPPLRLYVEDHAALYAAVLRDRPGITGLASLKLADWEERLLAGCASAEETDAVYRRRSIPRKARLDLIYQKNRNLCFDLALMGQTAARPFRRRRG
ncbi:MAG: sugar transferase [Rubellimicrobium sp.]|nr:sugar transferase [Rubellimicrobium sp.]